MSRMECGENADLLLEFAAGRLDTEAKARLENHLETCPACRELAGGHRAVWEALDAWEAQPVSADFDRRLYSRIEREPSWRDRLAELFRPALVRRGLPIAAAACLVVLVGVIGVERSANVAPAPQNTAVQLETLRPDQAESALQDMEMLRQVDGLVRPDAAASKM